MHDNGDREWALARLNRWRTSREPEALGQLIKWQRDRAYAIALRIHGNGADAEDAVQQACIKLLSRTHGLDTLDQFKVTVYRAVVQCAMDMARANRVRAKLEKAMSPLERQSPIPLLAAEQAEALSAVWQELHALSEESRAMVVLCYQEGLSVSDAAEVLAVPRETLRDRLAAAMSELRKKLSQRGVMLSLFIIAGLLEQGSAEAAPPGLCEALDVTLPGQPCSEVPAAKSQPSAPEFASVPPPRKFPKIISLGMAASIFVGAAIWLRRDSTTTAPYQRQSAVNAATHIRTNSVDNGALTPESPSPTSAAALTKLPEVRNDAPAAASVATKALTPALNAAAPSKPNAAIRAAKKIAEAQDQPVALADVPAAVLATAENALAGVVLKEAERKTEGNRVIYEIKGEIAGEGYDIVVYEDGTLVKITPDDDIDDADDVAKKTAVPPAAPQTEF